MFTSFPTRSKRKAEAGIVALGGQGVGIQERPGWAGGQQLLGRESLFQETNPQPRRKYIELVNWLSCSPDFDRCMLYYNGIMFIHACTCMKHE